MVRRRHSIPRADPSSGSGPRSELSPGSGSGPRSGSGSGSGPRSGSDSAQGGTRRRRAFATAAGGAIAGLIAAALALGVAEVVAGALGRAVSPAIVVGGAAIDRTPRFLKEFAIEEFGENDKKVLLTGIFVVIALIAAGVGALATRHRRTGLAGVALLGLIAAATAATRPTFEPLDVLPSLVAALVGVLTLSLLLDALPQTATDPSITPAPHSPVDPPNPGGPPKSDGPPNPAEAVPDGFRRGVLLATVAAFAAVVTGVGGRTLLNRRTDVDASRRDLVLPKPVDPASALPAGAILDVKGISSFYTSNREFYRVDTALAVPRLTTDDWRLHVHGMVRQELDLSFSDLLKRPIVEHDITLTCVSNEVGGKLLGTARWLGVELASILREAGVKTGADQLVGKSVDGMTIGTPVSIVTDGRAAMLAIAMNGEPLLPEHGFPVRMIVPGLYGYVSATKWLVDLELSTFDAFDPYWVRRGWDQQAPIKTSSRIDTPKPLSTVKPGRVAVAGVAWAQHRGISDVEVRVDGGAWQRASLSKLVNTDLWRQWIWEWDAPAGSHTLQVRATDGDGRAQVEKRTAPFPNGSTGWQSVLVTVRD
jgi:DMSO/TMAO reductase YedYZ molybdopterin-dependent catalytic subunit